MIYKKNNMLFSVLLLFIINSCITNNLDSKINKEFIDSNLIKKTTKYYDIFNDLNYSFTILATKENKEDRLIYFNIDDEKFKEYSLRYNNAVQSFFDSEKDILDTLLTFQNDTSYCEWTMPHNPVSSFFNFIEHQKYFAARVLFHNYLVIDRKEILREGKLNGKIILYDSLNGAYINRVEVYLWDDLIKWLADNKNLSKEELKLEYIKHPPSK